MVNHLHCPNNCSCSVPKYHIDHLNCRCPCSVLTLLFNHLHCPDHCPYSVLKWLINHLHCRCQMVIHLYYPNHCPCSVLKCLLGSGPKGVDDLCFRIYGEFSPSPSPQSTPPSNHKCMARNFKGPSATGFKSDRASSPTRFVTYLVFFNLNLYSHVRNGNQI